MTRGAGPLDPARWARITNLFADALEQPAGERRGFVQRRAGDDGLVQNEVLDLLRAHEEEGPLDGAPTDAERLSGARLGSWELVRELGRGGMGAVYLARRADGQFELEAAVKVHRGDFAGAEARRRFLVERQILAQVAHPNIARLLDGGVSDAVSVESGGLLTIHGGVTLSGALTLGALLVAAAPLLALLGRPDSTPLLSKITVPTLVLCGAEDILTPPDVMRDMAARIPNAEYVEIPDAGHMAPLEDPAAVNAAIRRFVAAHVGNNDNETW